MATAYSSKEADLELLKQGAEAKVYVSSFYGRPCIVKERFVKTYRVSELDKKLTQRRIGQVSFFFLWTEMFVAMYTCVRECVHAYRHGLVTCDCLMRS